MDIRIIGVPKLSRDEDLGEWLQKYILESGIKCKWKCSKRKNIDIGLLWIEDKSAGAKFIDDWHDLIKWNLRSQRNIKLEICGNQDGGKTVGLVREENELIQAIWLQNAIFRAQTKQKQQQPKKFMHYTGNRDSAIDPVLADKLFEVSQVECGYFEYYNNSSLFYPVAALGEGRLLLGDTRLAIHLDHPTSPLKHCFRIDLDYWAINLLVASKARDNSSASVIMSMKHVPYIYRWENRLNKRLRCSSINRNHENNIGNCLVYRLSLWHNHQLETIYRHIRDSADQPDSIVFSVNINLTHQKPHHAMAFLNQELYRFITLGQIDFKVGFQLLAITYNGYLSPWIVLELTEHAIKLVAKYGSERTVLGLKAFYGLIPVAGPDITAAELSILNLCKVLTKCVEEARIEGSVFEIVRCSASVLVHRFRVTPTAIYLEGPEIEPGNRVLRLYKNQNDCFARLTFSDENGEKLGFSPDVDNREIYSRFLCILKSGIKIMGSTYSFLSFSSSSLRSSTCWIMSPFSTFSGEIVTAEKLIDGLGEFKDIQIPAKCAARIGQAFTETSSAVPVQTCAMLPDVRRNNRCFSDGCGTISQELLSEIRQKYPEHLMKNSFTVLQIRVGGAKGIVSLDASLPGKIICLRPSMVKFQAKGDEFVEVCGIADRSIPFYLNRPLTKILEDLGIHASVFLNLQNRMVTRLEKLVSDDQTAALTLQREGIATSSSIPSLLETLFSIGVHGQNDPFLRSVVEMCALKLLHDVKYRGRIHVPKAVRLYGLMDEYGWLTEGQIYCSWVENGHHEILKQSQVLITRSPTMHPGDVQIASAVVPPFGHHLRNIYNCVVFSQYGKRDLPSQLGGGDLDGDQFDIIWDKDLIPDKNKIQMAADYPRQQPKDIGRRVTQFDMMEFLITFMQNDRVANISHTHQQLADLLENGTKDPRCLRLADMASLAVDYNKTGQAVDMSLQPRFPNRNWKPDFMIPSPKMKIEQTIESDLVAEIEELLHDGKKDAFEALYPSDRKLHYYESQKVIGQLFRAIDEKHVHRSIVTNWYTEAEIGKNSEQLKYLLGLILHKTSGLWHEHHFPMARKIRKIYEDFVNDARTEYAYRQCQPLHEIEVLCGLILGSSTRVNRDNSFRLKRVFAEQMAYVREMIIHGDEENDSQEALARSIACFVIGMYESGHAYGKKKVISWSYFAASICVIEIKRSEFWFQSL